MNVPVKTRRFSRGLEVDLHTCREGTPRTAIHTHDFVEFGYVVRGNAMYHIGRRQEFAMLAGMAMIEYLTRVRVRRACELLETTPAAVTDICFRVGFNDLSHFIRTFRKTVGTTPTDYRRKSR